MGQWVSEWFIVLDLEMSDIISEVCKLVLNYFVIIFFFFKFIIIFKKNTSSLMNSSLIQAATPASTNDPPSWCHANFLSYILLFYNFCFIYFTVLKKVSFRLLTHICLLVHILMQNYADTAEIQFENFLWRLFGNLDWEK